MKSLLAPLPHDPARGEEVVEAPYVLAARDREAAVYGSRKPLRSRPEAGVREAFVPSGPGVR
ncbi:MAG TPA: hypothetical protein VGE85_04880 [Terracidiphilus sp.]